MGKRKLMCTKYMNIYGTIFLDCSNKDCHSIISPYTFYREELRFCPFCGEELEDMTKEETKELWD